MYIIKRTMVTMIWEIFKLNFDIFQVQFTKRKFSLPVKKPGLLRVSNWQIELINLNEFYEMF